ncbi:UNVERIFIED_CONTAM: hypothetical protein GTU68_066442, partial [Idotea baltica]|nr:hypothetical protein [Idotea baltica]
LSAACANGAVLPIYILDETAPSEFSYGAASRWWLYHSLTKLNQSLDGKLSLFRGNPKDILDKLIQRHPVESVYWNRCYEPASIERDSQIKKWLTENGVSSKSYNGSLLWEPWKIKKQDGTPYKVFTPYYRRGCLSKSPPREPIAAPTHIELVSPDTQTLSVEELDLLPETHWDKKLESQWNIGEIAAQQTLEIFIESGAGNYKNGRNFPSENATSRLSPHLSFGEISPNQIWRGTSTLPLNDNVDCFRSELGWREFSYYLLFHFPELPTKNFQPKFDQFEWQPDKQHLDAWTTGNTGIPIVDAGMRELWETGYMHNRVRMIVASFLVKNLLQHWHEGAQWFWDCLVDADLASNAASWQ